MIVIIMFFRIIIIIIIEQQTYKLSGSEPIREGGREGGAAACAKLHFQT